VAEDTIPANESAPLSERVQKYCKEVERLVQAGIEHPCYELTRECSLSKANAKTRANLIKLVQGLANAHLHEERFIVVGADQENRRFAPVTNTAEFDPARLIQVLGRYLNPVPALEVFNSLRTQEDIPYVLIVLAEKQPRPIMAKAELWDESNEGKVLLRKADIWIKVGTALRRATNEDVDAMIQERIAAEADTRARAQFARFRDEIIAAQELIQPSGRRPPTSDLIYGKDENFRLYVQDIIISCDQPRFDILIELLRDLLVEGWYRLDAYSAGPIASLETLAVDVLKHKKDYFSPAMRRLVEVGFLLIKHNVSVNWFLLVRDLLVEVFGTAGSLRRLKPFETTTIPANQFEQYAGEAIPALEALIGARTVAVYAIKRKRFEYLAPLLKQYVPTFGAPKKILKPLLFWPLRVRLEMPEGLISLCWERRVQQAWSQYFGNQDDFIKAACQLEFVVEMNSYLSLGHAGENARQWFNKHRPDVSLAYGPDLWRYSLSLIVPLAEEVHEALQRGTGDMLLNNLTVEKAPFELLLGAALDQDRLSFLAGYLVYLRKLQWEAWQSKGQILFDPWFEWGEKLGPLVEGFKKSSAGA